MSEIAKGDAIELAGKIKERPFMLTKEDLEIKQPEDKRKHLK